MSKSSKIIDQPLAAREIIFTTRLKELIEETGVGLAIATMDATTPAPAPEVKKKETVAKKK